MPKILSQAGISLADAYDVEGSIVGVENLDSQDVSLVHEMGGQIFSERLQTNLTRLNPGDTLQSVTWNTTIPILPDSPNRIMAVSVMTNVAARVNFCSLAVQAVVGGREIVIWSWDDVRDVENEVRFSDDGAAVGTEFIMLPSFTQLPYLVTRTSGNDETNLMGALIFRGLTLAFGAGTVEPRMIIALARANQRVPDPGQPSSHGLPVPSW